MAGVVEVNSRRDLRSFIEFPYELYKGDPCWVPPLRKTVRELLTAHPFHKHATVRYFLARRSGRVAGRIAAIVNHRYNQFHNTRCGFFGFFESVEDRAIAEDLLHCAAEVLRRQGMQEILGPASPSPSGEFGLLIDGYERPPCFLMPYHKAYYRTLIEGADFHKARDLYAYEVRKETLNERTLELLQRISARLRNLRIRQADMRRFEHELEVVTRLYNEVWEENWGFDPISEEELRFEARQMKPVVDPRVALFAEVDGRTVGFAFSLPDLNVAFRVAGGRLFPFGFLRFFAALRKITRIRTLLLGVLPSWRDRGLDGLLYWETIRRGLAAGYVSCECSWILEDNVKMRGAIEKLGGKICQTYRVYRKNL